jgi:hypothetical protein
MSNTATGTSASSRIATANRRDDFDLEATLSRQENQYGPLVERLKTARISAGDKNLRLCPPFPAACLFRIFRETKSCFPSIAATNRVRMSRSDRSDSTKRFIDTITKDKRGHSSFLLPNEHGPRYIPGMIDPGPVPCPERWIEWISQPLSAAESDHQGGRHDNEIVVVRYRYNSHRAILSRHVRSR